MARSPLVQNETGNPTPAAPVWTVDLNSYVLASNVSVAAGARTPILENVPGGYYAINTEAVSWTNVSLKLQFLARSGNWRDVVDGSGNPIIWTANGVKRGPIGANSTLSLLNTGAATANGVYSDAS